MSAAMARRTKRSTAPRAVALDHGPGIRLARGDVVVLDRADPDTPNRTVRGARVAVHYAAMSLTETQREAADRLCVQAERAGGAAWRPEGIVVALHPSQRGHPAEWQVAATTDLRHAQAALGAVAWGLVWRLVVQNVPLVHDAPSGHARAVLTGRVLAGLDRLVEHWGME
jgi:hypothetical protein